ncbi:MAG: ABC transporter substrate-binding protein, partial [Candidatus Tectomicrobia bacterium]|nr:ABC transporter substrate-binding protein [Candidatus Tectomicrobia bacterium]
MNHSHLRQPVTRRGLLAGLAAFGAASTLGKGFSVLAQTGDTVRIGVLLPLTGDVDIYARQMRMGVETAIAEINDAGGVLGRPLEAAYRDSETTPSVLPDHCRELVGD